MELTEVPEPGEHDPGDRVSISDLLVHADRLLQGPRNYPQNRSKYDKSINKRGEIYKVGLTSTSPNSMKFRMFAWTTSP